MYSFIFGGAGLFFSLLLLIAAIATLRFPDVEGHHYRRATAAVILCVLHIAMAIAAGVVLYLFDPLHRDEQTGMFVVRASTVWLYLGLDCSSFLMFILGESQVFAWTRQHILLLMC
jgi:multisubunit Na+/H+ antiporter MnhG subunit